MVEEQIERWELRSGTWLRDRSSETWRLASRPDGTVVDPRLAVEDVGHLIGAHREPTSGGWFPPEFKYSQQTGAPLRMTLPSVDFPWVPPFGAPPPRRGTPLARGLRLTPRPLALARPHERSARGLPDRSLPPLPPGPYRFVVDKFGLSCQTLVAVEPERGELHLLLPESKRWVVLERTGGASWGQPLRNPRGWRMELVQADGVAIAYCPSASGLTAVTPNAIALRCAVRHIGEAPALGGPVAWRGEIWLPVLGRGNDVRLVGLPDGATRHIVLPTHAPVPPHGFEAPVFDDLHVIWPSDEGQLVLRLDADGHKRCDWIAWPASAKPLFALGWPYRPAIGTWWQLCQRSGGDGFDYVQMATTEPETAPVDGLRLCTGRACYHGTQRIDVDPWQAAPARDAASTEIVMPMLESAQNGAVVGLEVAAPDGAIALLQAQDEQRSAVLQVEVPGQPRVPFGTIHVASPWLTRLFVHDKHLWAAHPDLPQALGWELAL